MPHAYLTRAKCFIATYASDYNGELPVGYIKEHIELWMDLRVIKGATVVIGAEGPDDKCKRNHCHVFCYFPDDYDIKISKKSWDVRLRIPVYAFYDGKLGKKETRLIDYLPEDFFNKNKIDPANYKKIEEIIGGKIKDHQLIRYCHPNIQPMRRGNSREDMLKYCIKANKIIWSTIPIEDALEMMKKIDNMKKEDEVKKEPPFEQWKEQGLTLKEVMHELRTNWAKLTCKNWNRWAAGIHFVFGTEKEEFEPILDRDVWIPVSLYNWLIEVVKPYAEHQNDEEWIKAHRNDRPKSYIWEGPSKIGKTTFIRSIVDNNYYQCIFDGFDDFEENKPITILDDWGYEVKKLLPNWKSWLGGQTDFTVNPKYGRRRRVAWGHPCIFLTNFENIWTLENGFNKNDLDYLNKNCIFEKSNERKLWKKPDNNLGNMMNLVKVNVGELRKLLYGETKIDEINYEDNNDNLNASDIENENKENIPILINDNENGRPKIDGTTNWEYAENLPGYKGQLFRVPNQPRKRERIDEESGGPINKYLQVKKYKK